MSVFMEEGKDTDVSLGEHVRWQVESVAAGMHVADAAVLFADIAEWAQARAHEETASLANLMAWHSSYSEAERAECNGGPPAIFGEDSPA